MSDWRLFLCLRNPPQSGNSLPIITHPLITRIYADDGSIIAEYSHERRILVPFEKIPKTLVQAFVAAEDASFFKHQGIDFISIFRAALKNVKAGGIAQGGSTITQQVAKKAVAHLRTNLHPKI